MPTLPDLHYLIKTFCFLYMHMQVLDYEAKCLSYEFLYMKNIKDHILGFCTKVSFMYKKCFSRLLP